MPHEQNNELHHGLLAKPNTKPQGKAKRTRRSSEEITALVNTIIEFVKGKKEGVSGKEITKRYGKLMPSISEFVNSRQKGSLKTKGKGSATLYLAA